MKGALEVVGCEMDVVISKKQSCIQSQCWNCSWKLEGVKKDMEQIVNSLFIACENDLGLWNTSCWGQ